MDGAPLVWTGPAVRDEGTTTRAEPVWAVPLAAKVSAEPVPLAAETLSPAGLCDSHCAKRRETCSPEWGARR